MISEAEQFEDEVDRVIPLSKHALIFANAQWLTSSDCQREAAVIMAHLPPERIVVVETGDCEGVYAKFPQLRQAMVVGAATTKSPEDVFRAVARQLQIAPPPSATRWLSKSSSYTPAMPLDKHGLKVDLEVYRRRASERIVRRPETSAGQYGCGEEENDLRLHIDFIPHSATPSGGEDPLDKMPDAEAYERLRVHADQWARLHNYEPEGLHFLTCGVGTAQGFTYCYDAARSRDNYVWERRYIVYFGDKGAPKSEVHFVFSKLYAKKETTKGDQRDFCSYTPLFERIVSSATLDPKAARIRPHAVGLASLKTMVAFFVVLIAMAYTSVASVLLATSLAVDAALSWLDRTYRVLQAMHWGGPVSPEGGEHCTPARAFAQGALFHAPSTLFYWLFDVVVRAGAWALPLLLGVLAFNRLAPQHALPLQAWTILTIATLATLVTWWRQVSAMKRAD